MAVVGAATEASCALGVRVTVSVSETAVVVVDAKAGTVHGAHAERHADAARPAVVVHTAHSANLAAIARG